MSLFFISRFRRDALSTAKRGVDQQIQIWCLKGLGATPNKPSGASCLDTDIACQFVFIVKEKKHISKNNEKASKRIVEKTNNKGYTK